MYHTPTVVPGCTVILPYIIVPGTVRTYVPWYVHCVSMRRERMSRVVFTSAEPFPQTIKCCMTVAKNYEAGGVIQSWQLLS